jgi:hypothetical protein
MGSEEDISENFGENLLKKTKLKFGNLVSPS